MADNNQLAGGNNDDDIFVYMGGEQQVPFGGRRVPIDVKRAKIDETVDTIPSYAFRDCEQLIEVEGHDKLMKIEHAAFMRCPSLIKLTKMNGVVEIEDYAFGGCHALSDVEFDKLEIIGDGYYIGSGAFYNCNSLRSINLPSIKTVGAYAFADCTALNEAVFGKGLECIKGGTFNGCTSLRRIAIPLENEMSVGNRSFYDCDNLSRIDVVGEGIYKTISSFHMESWKNEMNNGMERINQTLPDTRSAEKTTAIRQWIRFVHLRMEYYKTEHRVVLKEAMTLLELALWKAKLLDEEGRKCKEAEEKKSKKAKIDVNSARDEHRVTCGANIVIKNVLPFLALQ